MHQAALQLARELRARVGSRPETVRVSLADFRRQPEVYLRRTFLSGLPLVVVVAEDIAVPVTTIQDLEALYELARMRSGTSPTSD